MWYEAEASERRIAMGLVSDFGTTSLTHPDACGLFEMWQALRGDRPAPFRAELDAAKIGARAPFLAILEYVGPSNFRIRIAGDRLNAWFGIELRGMSALSMIQPEARNHFQSVLNRLAGEPAVAALRGQARRADGFTAAFEMTLLPMRSDFGRIDRVLVGLWLLDAPARTHGPLRLDPTEFVVTPIRDEGPEAGPGEDELRAPESAFDGADDAPPTQRPASASEGDGAGSGDATQAAPRRPQLRVITGGRGGPER